MMGTLTAEEAFYNLRYGIGIVLEVAVAYWLLSSPHPPFGPGAVLAYFLIATSVFALLLGFFWYMAWFAQRNLAGLYLLAVSFLVGIGLWSAGVFFKPDAPELICGRAPYPQCTESSNLVLFLTVSGSCLIAVPVLYGAWRLVRSIVVRLFRVLLVAISQIAAAWRGELHR